MILKKTATAAAVLSLCALSLLSIQGAIAQEVPATDWQEIKSETLEEWSDPGAWWKVENGVIIAESKGGKDHPKVHYLVWNGSVKGDFELSLEYRILSNAPQDAGVNFRVERPFEEAANLPGYQAELDTAYLYGSKNGKLFGNIHDGKRGRMFRRGQRVTIKPNGAELLESLPEPFIPAKVFRQPPEWNACRIQASGDHIKLYLNGVLANEIIDGDTKMKSTGDAIALQCRPTNPYRFEVKNLKFRPISKSEHP